MTNSSFFQRPWLPHLLLALLVVAVFAPSISNDFVFFDDDKAILYNKALLNPSFSNFFKGQNLGMYAPLTWIAYWVGHSISGTEAWGYHLLGMLLHALNACLVLVFLNMLSGRQWPVFFAAVLFAVHPVQVEAVSWAAALSTVLFSTFYLLSLIAYLQWKRNSKIVWIGLSLLAFIAACFSKSAAVTLPLVLLAVDYYWGTKNAHSKLNVKTNGLFALIPYFALALIFGLYTFSTRAQEGHDIAAASAAFSMADRFFMVCQTLLFYPLKMLVPFGFSISYPFVKMDGAWGWEYYAAPVVLAVLGYLVWKYWRNNPDALLGLALYLLPLSIMLPFRTVGTFEMRFDRYVYLSCMGLFFIGGIFAEKLKPILRNVLMLALAAVLGFLAYQQTSVWADGVKLFRNCTEKTPESSLCQCNLAYNQLISNNFEGAAKHYTEALIYDPNVVEAYNGRGQAYFHLRKYPEALVDFTKAIQGGIVTPKLFLNRGKCLVILNRASEALPDLNRSIELEPKSAETYYFRGIVFEKAGDFEKAVGDYGRALELNPNYVEALVNRGLLRVKAAQYTEAISDYSSALPIAAPSAQPMILNNRAYAKLKSGQTTQALEDADRALRINPNYPFAYHTRAAIYQQMGQVGKAEADLAKAKQLQGG